MPKTVVKPSPFDNQKPKTPKPGFVPSGYVPPPAQDIIVRRAQWNSMREEFIQLTSEGKDVHWPTLAAKYNKSPAQARNKASKERWYAEIKERTQEREAVLEEKLRERSSLAIEKLQNDFATNEAEIRKRHATIARNLQAKAYRRLAEMSMADFSPSDVLKMLKLGLDEERFAIGMPETYEGPKADLLEATPDGYKPLVQQMGGHKKITAMASQLLKTLQGIGVHNNLSSKVSNSSDLEEAGLEPTDAEIKPPKGGTESFTPPQAVTLGEEEDQGSQEGEEAPTEPPAQPVYKPVPKAVTLTSKPKRTIIVGGGSKV